MRRLFLLLFALLLSPLASAAEGTGQLLAPTPDQLLAESLQALRTGHTEAALKNLDHLLAHYPDFRLAHLVKADLLLARSQPIGRFGAGIHNKEENELSDLRDEARMRFMRYLDQPDPGLMPLPILQLAPGQTHALLADASRARLYLFENDHGTPRLVRDFYMTIGRQGLDKRLEGDRKTPVGVYQIQSQLSRRKLPRYYGAGAFTLNYPNMWDRLNKRLGHGIWIHGVPPGTYSRAPRASDGCLVISNPDFETLRTYLKPGNTPVVIAERVEWTDLATWESRRKALLEALSAIKTPSYSSIQSDKLALFLQPEEHLAVVAQPDAKRHRLSLYLRQHDNGWQVAIAGNSPHTNTSHVTSSPINPNVTEATPFTNGRKPRT